MKKELEALENLWSNLAPNNYCINYSLRDRKILIQALTELQQIKSAKPSKALECLERMKENARVYINLEEYEKDSDTIQTSINSSRE